MSSEHLGLCARLQSLQYDTDEHGLVTAETAPSLMAQIEEAFNELPEVPFTIFIDDAHFQRMQIACKLGDIAEAARDVQKMVNYGRRSDGLHDARTKAISDAMGIVCQYADEASESV